MWVTWTGREGYGRYKATIRVAGVKRRIRVCHHTDRSGGVWKI